ncbi:hypothetical protein D3C80_1401350 [compost metagenome]
MQRVALRAVVARGATLVVRVCALRRVVVETGHAALQLLGVDPAACGQLRQVRAAEQVATPFIEAGREGERLGPADAMAALRGVIADQPGLRCLAWRRGREQRIHEGMVAVGLVDEPPAVPAHGNETGLRTVDQVRKMAEATVASWHL